jgi:hypothetical protein
MQSHALVLFANSRPFEPFRIFVADGRKIDVRHPETVMISKHVLGVWILHTGGEVEVIEADLITGLKTLHGVNPENFMGSTTEKD